MCKHVESEPSASARSCFFTVVDMDAVDAPGRGRVVATYTDSRAAQHFADTLSRRQCHRVGNGRPVPRWVSVFPLRKHYEAGSVIEPENLATEQG